MTFFLFSFYNYYVSEVTNGEECVVVGTHGSYNTRQKRFCSSSLLLRRLSHLIILALKLFTCGPAGGGQAAGARGRLAGDGRGRLQLYLA